MNTFSITELKDNTYFTENLMLDTNYILCTPEIPISDFLLQNLRTWEFLTIYSEGTISKKPLNKKQDLKVLEDAVKNQTDKVNQALKDALNNASSKNINNNDKARLAAVRSVYNEYMAYINNIYTHFVTHRELDYADISSTIKTLCIFIKENKRYVLRITPTIKKRHNYLICHSMRTTILSITIGLQLRMPLSKLIELGVAAMLHEIGMVRLPPQLYLNQKPLTPNERSQMATHTVIGYTILKNTRFPLSIQLGVLEHHEKENGTGYPRHLANTQISLYAKIIAVASSFEAMTAPRGYREAKTSYDAMIEMIGNDTHIYDETITKALLYSLSFFPIGVFVYLANGKIGQVTDVNPENPKNPIVQLLGEENTDGSPKTMQSDNNLNKIVRVLSNQEAKDVIKTFSKKTATT